MSTYPFHLITKAYAVLNLRAGIGIAVVRADIRGPEHRIWDPRKGHYR